jgi:hypothetical protein
MSLIRAKFVHFLSTFSYYKLVDDDYEKKLPLNAPADGNDELMNGDDNNVDGIRKCDIPVREFNQRFCDVIDRIYATILSEDKRV